MQTEELAEIDKVDDGPIEEHLHALATAHELPRLAIGACTKRIDEAAPALRAVLSKAASGETLTRDEEWLLFRGLYILGESRDTEAFPDLIRLIHRPLDEVENLLGDMITAGLSKIVVGTFDGNAEALFSVAADESLDEFIRDALIGAATFLTWEGRIDSARTREFLTTFLDNRLAPPGDYTWFSWAMAIALLAFSDLAPLVRNAWPEIEYGVLVYELDDFEEILARAEQNPGDRQRLEDEHLGYIEDAAEAQAWAKWVDPEEADERGRFDDDGWDVANRYDWKEMADLEFDALPTMPVTNAWRHVGRNDPCPCGSGKKAKKCCLPG